MTHILGKKYVEFRMVVEIPPGVPADNVPGVIQANVSVLATLLPFVRNVSVVEVDAGVHDMVAEFRDRKKV